MGIKTLKSTLLLPITMEQAWDFFSSPQNLNEITPSDMTFNITSEIPEKMYEGLIIAYKVSPILNIPLTWVTEITHIKEHSYFVDEQRKGPYRMWHHEHHFREVPGGVEMTDILHYDVGKGIFGAIASVLFVENKVKQIFNFREKKLKEMFGEIN
jgi:ligand-binding SRPBCC domain-containing protein